MSTKKHCDICDAPSEPRGREYLTKRYADTAHNPQDLCEKHYNSLRMCIREWAAMEQGGVHNLGKLTMSTL